MKYAFAVSLAFFTSQFSAFAAPLWDELDSAQHARIINNEMVRVDGTNPNFWEANYYIWVRNLAPHTGPRGCAAIFWDLPGQVSYQPNLISFNIVAGEGTAAVKSIATVQVPPPGAPGQYSYPQENTIFRIGDDDRDHEHVLYTSSWQTTDPNQPISPGFPFFSGDVSFQSFPGDGGGSLMKYHVKIAPIAPLVGNAVARDQAFQALGGVVQLHKTRMEQGATNQQINRLNRSLN